MMAASWMKSLNLALVPHGAMETFYFAAPGGRKIL